MNRITVITLSLFFSAPTWAQGSPPTADYKRPYPHSSGAELLPYCEQTDDVVNRIRCDYYVQAVADMATMPSLGESMACIPAGKTRTELMQVAVNFLQKMKAPMLEKASAASLLLTAFRKAFPCHQEGKDDEVVVVKKKKKKNRKSLKQMDKEALKKLRQMSAEDREALQQKSN